MLQQEGEGEATTPLIIKSENDSVEKENGDIMKPQNNLLIDTHRERLNSSLFSWLLHHEKERDIKDKTPEARQYRKRMMLRAVYGEFVGTTIFMTSVFSSIINLESFDTDPAVVLLCVALVASFSVIAVIMCFSQISGSNLNPAISFALWLTGRLSNRKFILYVVAQLSASVFSMFIIFLTFSNPTIEMYKLVAIKPAEEDQLWRVFFTQVVGSFMLTYVAFTMGYEEAALIKEAESKVKKIHASDGLYLFSSSPQSATGFAPFAVGFIVFVCACYGGSSGCALNPSRMFGPAIFSGVWDYFYIYWIGMFVGSGLAGLLVVHVQLIHTPTAPII